MMMFVGHGRVIDKMYGVVPEAQLRQAFTAFTDWFAANRGSVAPGSKEDLEAKRRAELGEDPEKLSRLDEHEENAMTLQQAAIRKVQAKDYAKGYELFTKSRTLA